MRIGLILGAVLASVLALSACGSSSSKTDAAHGKAVKAANVVLKREGAQFSDPPLVTCAQTKAAALPTARLQAASAVPASQKQFAAGLFTTCVRAGTGVAELRQGISQSLDQSATTDATSGLPPSYLTCVKQKAQVITPDQIADIIAVYPQGQSAVEAKGKALGEQLGVACFSDPEVSAALREKFLEPIKSGLSTGQFSAAYRKCVLQKAEAVPTQTIVDITKQALADNASGSAQGEALGKKWGKQCIASGATP